MGGKSGRYCSGCKTARDKARLAEVKAAGLNDPNARKCETAACNARAPVGSGKFCSDCYRENRNKRRRKK